MNIVNYLGTKLDEISKKIDEIEIQYSKNEKTINDAKKKQKKEKKDK